MLLKYFYDSHLAQASYLIGCQATGEALVVDPSRDITPYLEEAERNNFRIVGAAETHIHADYVSGARELAERGATLYLSDCGEEPWKYRYAHQYPHRLLRDGDHFQIGNLRFDVLHTPGHTPEHITFQLTDTPATPRPMGLFTGDFLFVGSLGRPDLLEKAVGISDSALAGAKQMFASVQRLRALPDYLQILPGHGAGSACGKGLGSVPNSTLGYERIANPFLQELSEAEFVAMLLEGQPEPPTYFAIMKRVNRDGTRLLAELPTPTRVGLGEVLATLESGGVVVDTRPTKQFAAAHLPGALNIPQGSLGEWAGWLLPYDREITLLVPQGSEEEVLQPLRAIGVDTITAIGESTILEEARRTGIPLQSYQEVEVTDAARQLEAGDVTLLDVRSASEWEEQHISDARHIMLGTLPQRLHELPQDKPFIVQCRSANRSAIAAALLQAAGFPQVVNLAGGISAWKKAGLPVEE